MLDLLHLGNNKRRWSKLEEVNKHYINQFFDFENNNFGFPFLRSFVFRLFKVEISIVGLNESICLLDLENGNHGFECPGSAGKRESKKR